MLGSKGNSIEGLMFNVAFVIFCIATFLDALHKSAFPFLPMALISNYLRILASLIAYTLYLKKERLTISLLIPVFFAILLPLYFRSAYTSQIFASLSLILVARYVKFDVIVDWIIKYLSIALIAATVLSVLGIIPNETVYKEVPIVGAWKSYYMGFHYFSTPAYYGMTLVILLLYKKRLNCSYRYLLFLTGLSFLVFVVAFARLQFLINLLTIIAYIVVYKWKLFSFRGKIWKYIAMLAFPVMTLVIVFLSFSLILLRDSSFFEFINEWTSTRMVLNIQAFLTYDINLFGNLIEVKTRDLVPGESYFFIDSGYVYYLLSYGLVFYVFLMVMYGRIFYNVWKCNCKFLYIILLIFSVANMFNNFMVSVITCPVVLLMFADFEKQDSLYEGRPYKLRKLKQYLIVKSKVKMSLT